MTTSHDVIAEKIDQLSAAGVRAWLMDRLANCQRIAAQKSGEDRDRVTRC